METKARLIGANSKVYVGKTPDEFYLGWVVKQIRTKGAYTYVTGYRAVMRGRPFILAARYKDLKDAIKQWNKFDSMNRYSKSNKENVND